MTDEGDVKEASSDVRVELAQGVVPDKQAGGGVDARTAIAARCTSRAGLLTRVQEFPEPAEALHPVALAV